MTVVTNMHTTSFIFIKYVISYYEGVMLVLCTPLQVKCYHLFSVEHRKRYCCFGPHLLSLYEQKQLKYFTVFDNCIDTISKTVAHFL